MQTRRSTNNGVVKALAAFALACVVACVLWCIPCVAWAEEYDDIPVGVLTLCDNPFAIDCGHDHSSDGGEGGDSSPAAQDDVSVVPQDDEQACHSEPPSCHPEQSEGFPAIQTPSSDDASISASYTDDSPDLSIESSEDARVIVEDEDLGRHEYATILAEVKAGISRMEFDELITSTGGLSADDVSDEDLAYGVVRLGITDGSAVMDAVDRIAQIAGFLSVQPNYVYAVEAFPVQTRIDDTYRTRLWGLDSMQAYAAWDLVKTNNSVAVAVIDTGADLDHPDLAANIVATHNSLSAVNTVEDNVGHGTHVAGIVSSVANNRTGVAGSSYNADLVIIKAAPFKSTDFDTAAIVRAYAWLESNDLTGGTVAEHYNVRVVNLSIGGLDASRSANMRDDLLIAAMTKARDEYGLLTVVAAGNGTSARLPFASYPGDSEACLSVMNLDQVIDSGSDVSMVVLHETSNYNVAGTNYKDICAPGSNIVSTWLNGGYAASSGTSMAAPYVAGVAALLFAVDPSLTPQMVKSILEFTASDLGDEGWDERYGYGEVNAAAAVQLASAAHIDGFRAVGVGGSAGFMAFLGPGMAEGDSGWSWKVINGSGAATVDENGVLTGTRSGDVTLVATCTASTGVGRSVMRTVHILDEYISGTSLAHVGEFSTPFSTTDDSFTWVWQVENDTGCARIDQDAILVAEKAGVVYVTATCASNTDIVLRRKFTIVA